MGVLGWYVAALGWGFFVGTLIAHLRYRRGMAEASRAAIEAMVVAGEFIESVYKVLVSCPVCDWTELVVRESRETATAAANDRIVIHNLEQGHILTGKPQSGYLHGERVN